MGLTFLAAGTSIPDAIASLIVARQGKGFQLGLCSVIVHMRCCSQDKLLMKTEIDN